jgi:hypothetical protein
MVGGSEVRCKRDDPIRHILMITFKKGGSHETTGCGRVGSRDG